MLDMLGLIANFIVNSLWLIIPAGFANMAPVFFGGGLPMDFGYNLRDGRRILGDGKTWRGFASGVVVGAFMALILTWIAGSASYLPSFGEPVYAVYLGGVLGTGALFGDAVKSFFKRRLGKERGEKWPLADQWDFVLGSWLFAFLFARHWFVSNFSGDRLWIMPITLLMILGLHRLMNIIGYATKLKKVPW